MFKKLMNVIDLAIEYFKSQNQELKFTEPICPYIKGPCLRQACLSYTEQESEWNETEIVPNQEEPGTMMEIETGNRLSGKIGSCRAGLFRNWVQNKQIIKQSQKSSPIVIVS